MVARTPLMPSKEALNNPNAPEPWMNRMVQDAMVEAAKIRRKRKKQRAYSKYRDDPVGFGRDVFGEQYTEDVQKVMESVRDNPVTIAKSANSVGKSHSAALLAIWFYMVYHDSQVYTTAAPPLENLKKILWGEIMGRVRKHERIFSAHYIRTLTIARQAGPSPNSFITGVTIPTSGTREERISKFSGKHAPHLFFIVDEGDAVPDEVYEGIESCMSGGMVRLLIMFNPKAKSGPVYWKERDKQAHIVQLSAFRHPNVVKGETIIPGAVDRNTTVRRINEWTRPLHPTDKKNEKCFEVPEFLSGASAQAMDGTYYDPLPEGWREIKEPSFSHMVLGEYPAKGARQLISEEWINKARARYDHYVAQNGENPPKLVRPKLGIDIAEFGVDANVACLRYGSWVAPMITWGGVDTHMSGKKAVEIYRQNNVEIAYIDSGGYGSNIAPQMARSANLGETIRAIGVKASSKPSPMIKSELGEFYQMRDQMWWAVREWLRTDPGAMLPPNKRLIEELLVPTYEERKQDGKLKIMDKDKMRNLLKRSPDRADALCLTFAPFEKAKVVRLT